tara:strand:- start:15614 stop:16147 length:534 start_codon:yes stop_codon:yes gene_type:complete
MKINEVIITEIDGPDASRADAVPSSDRFKSSRPDNVSSQWRPTDQQRSDLQKTHGKEFVRFVMFAVQQPNISSMQDAIAFANAQMTIQQAKNDKALGKVGATPGSGSDKWNTSAAKRDDSKRTSRSTKQSGPPTMPDFKGPGVLDDLPGMSKMKSALAVVKRAAGINRGKALAKKLK